MGPDEAMAWRVGKTAISGSPCTMDSYVCTYVEDRAKQRHGVTLSRLLSFVVSSWEAQLSASPSSHSASSLALGGCHSLTTAGQNRETQDLIDGMYVHIIVITY